MHYFYYFAVSVLVILTLLFVWRFLTMRSQGNVVVVRDLPAKGVHGWRHGIIRYNEENVRFNKVRSLSLGADCVLGRGDVTITARRELTIEEAAFIDPAFRVLVISDGVKERELALSNRAETALTSWLESAPSQRLDRVNSNVAIREHAKGKKQR